MECGTGLVQNRPLCPAHRNQSKATEEVKNPDTLRKVEMSESTIGNWYPCHTEGVLPHLVSAIRNGDNCGGMDVYGTNLPAQASPDWPGGTVLWMTRQINLTSVAKSTGGRMPFQQAVSRMCASTEEEG